MLAQVKAVFGSTTVITLHRHSVAPTAGLLSYDMADDVSLVRTRP